MSESMFSRAWRSQIAAGRMRTRYAGFLVRLRALLRVTGAVGHRPQMTPNIPHAHTQVAMRIYLPRDRNWIVARTVNAS
jgi:hypothetical protein